MKASGYNLQTKLNYKMCMSTQSCPVLGQKMINFVLCVCVCVYEPHTQCLIMSCLHERKPGRALFVTVRVYYESCRVKAYRNVSQTPANLLEMTL